MTDWWMQLRSTITNYWWSQAILETLLVTCLCCYTPFICAVKTKKFIWDTILLSIFNYLLIRISCCGHRLPRLRERYDQYQAEDPVINNNSNNNNNNKYKITTATNRKRHNLYMWKILRVWALDLQRSEVKPQKGEYFRHMSNQISLFRVFTSESEEGVGCGMFRI